MGAAGPAGGGAGGGGELGELNRQFAAWVARRAAEPGAPRALGAGCRAYLAHLARLGAAAPGGSEVRYPGWGGGSSRPPPCRPAAPPAPPYRGPRDSPARRSTAPPRARGSVDTPPSTPQLGGSSAVGFALTLPADGPCSPHSPPRQEDGGALAVLGMGDMGQLGLGEDVLEAPVPRALPALRVVRAVACGGMHTVCLAGGALWSWGVNDEGALGRLAKTQNAQLQAAQGSSAPGGVPEDVPGVVELPAGHTPAAISAGDSHAVCISRQGAAFQWGTFRNAGGAFGMGVGPGKVVKLPEKAFPPASGAGAGERAVGVASGCDHVLLRTAGGRVYSWGCAERGRLGRVPEAEADLKEVPPAVKRDQLTPAPVPGLPADGAAAVFCGFLCSFVLAAGGQEAYGFGLNNYGQLSLPVSPEAAAKNAFYAPERLAQLEARAGAGGLREVAGGEHHTLFLTHQGRVFSVGRTTYGRLGRSDVDVNAADEAVLGPVEGLPRRVASVSAGVAVSACVGEGGELFTWGYGAVGQLCKRGDDDEPLPVRVAAQARALAGRRVHQVGFGGQHGALVTVPAEQGAEAAGRPRTGRLEGAPSAKRRR